MKSATKSKLLVQRSKFKNKQLVICNSKLLTKSRKVNGICTIEARNGPSSSHCYK